MNQKLFLVTYDSPNFHHTVTSPRFEEEDMLDKIPELSVGTDELRIWGVKDGPRNESNYEKMQSTGGNNQGDQLLFYNNKKYQYAGKVGQKFRSDIISRDYWIEGTEASMLYTVEDLYEIDLSRKKLNNLLGYEREDNKEWWPQGLQRVKESKIEKIISEFGSVDDFVNEQVEENEQEPWWKD